MPSRTAYIAAHSPVAPVVEGRITRSETAAPAGLPTTGGVLTAAGFALAGTGVLVRRKQG